MIKQIYISRRFDEAVILASLSHIAFSSEEELLDQDYAVLAALRRSSPDWNLSLTESSERLSSYSDEQIGGLVNNVKGILHEMEFMRLENDDGDSVVAALYPDTNHKGVDVQMFDMSTNDAWSVQLKATDDVGAINAWMESNPDTEILVTEELSEKMDISSTGFSNEELTVRVEDFVDRMIELSDESDSGLWEAFPPLVVTSAGIIIFELWRRYRAGQMSFDEFRSLTIKTIGLKAGKYLVLLSALSVPGLNVLAGAYLLGSFLIAVGVVVNRLPSFKPFHSLLQSKSQSV